MRKERKIINTNIRLNLCDEQDRQAWEYLQTMDRQKYKSYTKAVVAALNDYFAREYRNEEDPYLETGEKENAFLESREDIRMLYGEHSAMYRELELIRRGMILNITLEELICDLADRSGIEEIEQFSAILNIAKRGGGNVTQIIRTTAEVISNKVETMQEMLTMLQGRRLEQNVMEIMPCGISLYIAAAYPGYFGTLYHNGMGIIVMTLCLAVYAGAYLLGEKILDRIEEEL